MKPSEVERRAEQREERELACTGWGEKGLSFIPEGLSSFGRGELRP